MEHFILRYLWDNFRDFQGQLDIWSGDLRKRWDGYKDVVAIGTQMVTETVK